MSEHSPAEIIATFLINQGIFTNPSAATTWPVFYNHLPDGVGALDNCAVVYDTVGIKDGRLMEGSIIEHPGIQVLVRGRSHSVAWAKIKLVRRWLETITPFVQVTFSTARYTLKNISQTSPIIRLGKDDGTQKRMLFTLNYLTTLKEDALVLHTWTEHAANATLLAAAMEGQLHSNSGAVGATVTLTLPAAADGLNGWFVQIDAGDLVVNPQDGDVIHWSDGAMSAGESIHLKNPISKIYISSDGNNRWIVLVEEGTIQEETP